MKRNRARAAAVSLAMAAAITGCGGGDTDEAGADPSSRTEDAPIDESAMFSWGYVGPNSLDPVESISSFEYPFFNPLYDSLVTAGVDGTLSPGIAESWELSEDGSTFTMTITEGRTFHDGTPIDAEAVRANLDRAINSPDSTVVDLAAVESVESSGNTVTLTVSGGGGRLPAILADIPGMMVGPASFDDPEIDSNPIGSGPFTVAELTDGRIQYERWDDYHAADEIRLAGIEIIEMLDDNTKLAAVRSGELDATFIQPDQRAEAESGGLSVVSGVQNYVYSFNLNTTHPALAEPEVRTAVSHAIDRAAIDAGVFADGCEPTVQPYPQSSWAYASEVTVDEHSPYDPEAARDLLASAGFPDGFEIEVGAPNATPFTDLLEVIQAQLGEIGIEVIPVVHEPAQYVGAIGQGEYDAWVTAFETGRPDVLRFWQDNYLGGGAENPDDFIPPGFADLFDQAASEIEPDAQAPIIQAMLESVLDAGPRAITICVPDLTLISNDRIAGLEVPLNGNYSFRGITEAEG